MKYIKSLLVIGLVVFGGIFLRANSSLGQKEYLDELRSNKAKVDEYVGKVSGVEKEFVEKILNHED